MKSPGIVNCTDFLKRAMLNYWCKHVINILYVDTISFFYSCNLHCNQIQLYSTGKPNNTLKNTFLNFV